MPVQLGVKLTTETVNNPPPSMVRQSRAFRTLASVCCDFLSERLSTNLDQRKGCARQATHRCASPLWTRPTPRLPSPTLACALRRVFFMDTSVHRWTRLPALCATAALCATLLAFASLSGMDVHAATPCGHVDRQVFDAHCQQLSLLIRRLVTKVDERLITTWR